MAPFLLYILLSFEGAMHVLTDRLGSCRHFFTLQAQKMEPFPTQQHIKDQEDPLPPSGYFLATTRLLAYLAKEADNPPTNHFSEVQEVLQRLCTLNFPAWGKTRLGEGI